MRQLTTILHPEQEQDIGERIDRLMALFHPLSDQSADVLGILQALRGQDARLGIVRPEFIKMLTVRK